MAPEGTPIGEVQRAWRRYFVGAWRSATWGERVRIALGTSVIVFLIVWALVSDPPA